MKKLFNTCIRPILRRLGIEIIRINSLPVDFDEYSKKVYQNVRDYTMTSPERVFAIIEAVKYVNNNNRVLLRKYIQNLQATM